jgi:hypothetical protein
MPHSYQEMSDMFGGRINRPNYDPNKRGLVDGPGGYWGAHHGDPTGTTGVGSVGQGNLGLGGGWGPGVGNPDAVTYGLTNESDQYGGWLTHGEDGETVKYGELTEEGEFDPYASGVVSWGYGPQIGGEMHHDVERQAYEPGFHDPTVMRDLVKTDPLHAELYDDLKITPKMVKDVTDTDISALASHLGMSVSDLNRAYNAEAVKAFSAEFANQTSLANQYDRVKGWLTDKIGTLTSTPGEDTDFMDKVHHYGKPVGLGLGTLGYADMVGEYGLGPVAKLTGVIGGQTKMAQMMWGLMTGKPAFAKNAENFSIPTPRGMVNLATVIGDPTAYGYDNEDAVNAAVMGDGSSVFGAGYVDADKVSALGGVYSGSTQAMPAGGFASVEGMLADPLGQTAAYATSQGMMDPGAQGGGPEQEVIPGAEAEVTVDTSEFDTGQMAMYNNLTRMGYSEEYAAQYIRSLG